MSWHRSALLYHSFSPSKSKLANARSRQVPRLSGCHIPFCDRTITPNRSTCSTMCQGFVMEYKETISNCYKNSANVPANGSRVPANESGLISKEPIPNIDDLELVEALARL